MGLLDRLHELTGRLPPHIGVARARQEGKVANFGSVGEHRALTGSPPDDQRPRGVTVEEWRNKTTTEILDDLNDIVARVSKQRHEVLREVCRRGPGPGYHPDIDALLREDRAPFALARKAAVLALCERGCPSLRLVADVLDTLLKYEKERPAYGSRPSWVPMVLHRDVWENVVRAYERARPQCR